MKKRLLLQQQNGSVLVSLLLIMPFLILIAATYLSLAVNGNRVAQKDEAHTYAQLAADAGADRSVYEISQNANYAGTGSEVTLQSDSSVKTTYQTTVTTAADNTSKTITTIGRTYKPASSSTATSSVKIAVDLRPVTSGSYSVVTGVGGLYMSNSAKILGGSVQVNGEIQMSNTAQIGLTNSPITLTVANQNCPVPATSAYPRICNTSESTPPISISNSAHIYGDVKANNQVSGSGMSNPGLTGTSGVSAQSLPAYDRAAQKAAVASTQTGAAAGCSGSTTKTWPANLKITGNVDISNSCQVTVSGNVWITGKLTLSNTAKIIVSNSLGATRPVIMVDGAPTSVNLSNNTELKANSTGTGFEIITYYSRASCSPDCSDVTGTDLYNSRNDVTIDMNNSSGAGSTILYAHWSRVNLSNTGQIGALVGQTVQLSNSATITFGTAVSTGSTYWVINGYRRVF